MGDQLPLREVARAVTRSLDAPGLDLIPPEWLHVTLREVGYLEEIPPASAENKVDRARESLADLGAFSLRVGPVELLPGALVLRVTPTRRLDELRRRLPGKPSVDHGPNGIPAPDQVAPHVSLAYLRTDTVATHVIASTRTVAPLTLSIDQVILAEVTRHQWHYEWNVRARIHLLSGEHR